MASGAIRHPSSSVLQTLTTMAFQFALLAAMVAVASAGVIHHPHHGVSSSSVYIQTPVHGYHGGHDYYPHQEDEYHNAPAYYQYDYNVHDLHTGDVKSQQESRHGHEVKGSYSLVEADGSHRTVDYTADHSGFHATVHKTHPVLQEHAYPYHH